MDGIFNFNICVMQLEQQFLPIVYRIAPDKENEKRAKQCTEIAEKFAIGFAKFCLEENAILEDGKEILEIYKKTL